MNKKEFTDLIRSELASRGTNPYRAAKDAGLPDNAIRYLLEGKQPRMDRFFEICDALDLRINISNLHSDVSPKNRLLKSDQSKISPSKTDPVEAPVWGLDSGHPNVEYVMVHKYNTQLETKIGTDESDERMEKGLVFHRDWMRKYGLQSREVSTIDVFGDSMLPTLNDGATVLVNHAQRENIKRNKVVAARVNNDLFVKRYMPIRDNDVILISDNPEYDPIILGADDEIIGTVVWKGVLV